jgi:hypothetical protein
MAGEGSGSGTEGLSEAAKINERIQESIRKSKITLDEYNKALEERARLEEEQLKRQERLEELANKKKAAEEATAKIEGDRTALLEEIFNLEYKINAAKAEQERTSTENYKKQQQLNDLIENHKTKLAGLQRDYADGEKKYTENLENARKKQEKAEAAHLAYQKQVEKAQERIKKNQEEYNDDLKDTLDKQDKIEQVMSKYASKIPVIGSTLSKAFQLKGNLKDFAGFLGEMGKATDSALLGRMGESVLEFAGTVGYGTMAAGIAIAAYVAKLTQLALQIDGLSKSLGAATGFGDVFSDQLIDISTSSYMSGVSLQDASEAITAMSNGLSSFNPNAKKANAYIGTTTTRLKKLGVPLDASVKSIDNMQKVMGMSAEQAADTTAQIALMGKEIGVTSGKMMENFNASFSRMSLYGKQSTQVFKEMTSIMKGTGIEMGKLIGMAEKFDTFEGAAGQVSQLNAVLGTNIDTLQMVGATDAERIQIMQKEIRMSVGNFDNLGKYEKMMVAQAMGINDVAEAQRLLNMSQAEMNKNTAKQQEAAEIQEKMKEASEELVPIMDQLKLAFTQAFLAFAPLLKGLTWVVTTFGPALARIAKGFSLVAAVILTVATAWGILNIAAAIFAGTMTALGWPAIVMVVMAVAWGIGLLVDAFMDFFDVTHKSGSPMLYELPRYIAEGFQKMADGAKWAAEKIAYLAKGPIYWMYDAFHEAGSPMLYELPSVMAGYFTEMADSVSGVFGEMTKFIEAMTKFASLDFKGFVAIRSDGGSTSLVMGSEGVIKSLSEGKLTVDVNMPEIKMPDIKIEVVVNDQELQRVFDARIAKTATGK